YAMAGADIPDEDFWAPTLVPPLERTLLDRKAYIIHDVGSEIAAETVRGRLLRMVGARSALRVAIPLGNAVFGSLFFLARDPGRFSDEDIDFPRRVVGQSRQWQDVLAHAARVAQAETTVLLTGESGTGKEVVARFIHHASR